MIARFAIGIAALAMPAIAGAQAYRCSIPQGRLAIRPDVASASQPQRLLPIGGYTLAITWAPQYCRDHARTASARLECGTAGGGGNRFGFTLHGLWPDGVGKEWPQYCRATTLLPQALVRRHLCTTPSAQLMQHEWSKHGTCMAGISPTQYFAQSSGLYGALRYPDMAALSRTRLTAGGFAAAMARANPGLDADMMRITTTGQGTRQGWLDELWICLDTRFRYTRCPAQQGGSAASAPLSIWRGGR